MSSKKFRGNIERFRFIPILLNGNARKFFINLATLHLYNKTNTRFEDGKMSKYFIWYEVNYDEYLEEKEKGNDCKLICYSKEDRIKYGDEISNGVNVLG